MAERNVHTEREGREPDRQGLPRPLFALGLVVGTPEALQALAEAGQNPLQLLARHVTGDWGELDEADKAENDRSVQQGWRILSAYRLVTGVKVWLITEWDRRITSFLLPADY